MARGRRNHQLKQRTSGNSTQRRKDAKTQRGVLFCGVGFSLRWGMRSSRLDRPHFQRRLKPTPQNNTPLCVYVVKCVFVTLLWLAPIAGWGTQVLPWYGDLFELQPRVSVYYQTYRDVSSGSDRIRHSSDDIFVDASVSTALGYNEAWAAEVEVIGAHTRHQRQFNFDNVRLTGRYLVWDDVAGDLLSLVIGVTGIQAVSLSVNDISSFHHGKLEGEAHLSFGREVACGENWVSRWWMLAAIGIADVGSAWWRGIATWEWRLRESHALAVFGHYLEGLGGKRLHPHDFHGYGSIAHSVVRSRLSLHLRDRLPRKPVVAVQLSRLCAQLPTSSQHC